MSTADLWDLAINSVGLVGVVALAGPALFANRYGRLLYKLSKLDPRSSALRTAKADLESEQRALRDSWTWRSGALLIGGTALAGLSYTLGVAKAFIHPS